MSLIFGSGQKQKPQYSSLQVQSSSNNVAVPLGWGLTRVAPNLIGWWDFKSHKAKQQGGKGGGGKGGGQYTYTAAVAMALVIGPCDGSGVHKVFVDNDKDSSLAKLNLVLFTGTDPQAPWSYLTANHPGDALSYPSLVYVASPKYDLGSSASLPQHSFELAMRLYNTSPAGNGDADVALVIQDYLTMPIYGCLFPSTSLDTGTLLSTGAAGTTGDASTQTYCNAMGFGFSPILASQEEALTTLKRWCDTFNIAPVYNGAVLKFIPYALEPVSGHGVNFVPVSTSIYTLTDADFITSNDPNSEGDDPIKVSRKDPAKVKNRLQIEISSRAKEYNAVPYEWIDQGLIDQHGDLPDSVFTAHEVTDPAIATVCVSLMGQRNAFRGNNVYKMLLSPALILAEPMDLLTINDPQMGAIQIQIDKITEDDDYNLSFECSQVMFGATSSTGFNVPDQTNTGNDTGIDPGSVNTPIIFEPPSSLSTTAQVWAAVSGVNMDNWGGAFVWVSTDGTTYTQIGNVENPARMGKTSSILATYASANPDTAHTVDVDLTESAGSLQSVSATDAANAVTLCYLGGELISFRDATLISANKYTLGGQLYRGLYGSVIGAHAANSDFARLDEAIFKYDLPPQYIGQTLYFKFQSYNIYGRGTQDLTACTAYTFAPAGAGYGTGAGGAPAAPTGVAAAAGSGYNKITWTANSANDNVDHYDIYRAAGPGGTFGSATKIGNSAGTTYNDNTATPTTVYTYFVVAVNSIGPSAASAGADATANAVVATGSSYGFAFMWPNPTVSKPIAYFDTPVPWNLPAGLADCQGTIGDSDTASAAAPTANTDFDLQSPPGTSIGTMRFATGSLTATFIMASGHAIPLGQPVAIIAPGNLNGITGTVYGSLKGTRT